MLRAIGTTDEPFQLPYVSRFTLSPLVFEWVDAALYVSLAVGFDGLRGGVFVARHPTGLGIQHFGTIKNRLGNPCAAYGARGAS